MGWQTVFFPRPPVLRTLESLDTLQFEKWGSDSLLLNQGWSCSEQSIENGGSSAMEIPRLLGHVKGAVSAWCSRSLHLSLSPSLPIHTWEPSQTGYEETQVPLKCWMLTLPPTVPPKVPRLASTTGTVTGPPVQPASCSREPWIE